MCTVVYNAFSVDSYVVGQATADLPVTNTPCNESLDKNKVNPFSAPESGGVQPERAEDAGSRFGLALTGFLWSIVSTFPIAGVMALVFRFPVPFAGYVSGFDAIRPTMFAVAVYGVFFGGFVVVGLLGAIAGFVMATLDLPGLGNKKRAVQWVSLGIATVCLFVLAVLDWIIGPW